MKRLFPNATFVTMVDEFDTADALLVDDEGRIAFVGPLEEARERAYEACDLINFEGKQLRYDIGKKALQGRSAWE